MTWETLIQTSVDLKKIQEPRARSRLLFFRCNGEEKEERTASRAALIALTGVPRQLVVTEKSSTKLLRNFQSWPPWNCWVLVSQTVVFAAGVAVEVILGEWYMWVECGGASD